MDVATDVNIAVTRVYVERFISGRRDWGILNICGHIHRMNLQPGRTLHILLTLLSHLLDLKIDQICLHNKCALTKLDQYFSHKMPVI